jgi:hypothetical protein
VARGGLLQYLIALPRGWPGLALRVRLCPRPVILDLLDSFLPGAPGSARAGPRRGRTLSADSDFIEVLEEISRILVHAVRARAFQLLDPISA